MFLNDFIGGVLQYWMISIPIFCYVLYVTITELLDIIINHSEIKNLLKKSEALNIELFEVNYQIQKQKQQTLDKSTLLEMERQVRYLRNDRKTKSIIQEKELSDIFKIKEA